MKWKIQLGSRGLFVCVTLCSVACAITLVFLPRTPAHHVTERQFGGRVSRVVYGMAPQEVSSLFGFDPLEAARKSDPTERDFEPLGALRQNRSVGNDFRLVVAASQNGSVVFRWTFVITDAPHRRHLHIGEFVGVFQRGRLVRWASQCLYAL